MARPSLARAAGIGIILMAVIAGFAVAMTQGLVVAGDGARTTGNIASHESLFRAGLCAWLLIAALDILVAVALYVVFVPANRTLSLLAAAFRVVYAAVLIASLGGLFGALGLLETGSDVSSEQVVIALRSFGDLWAAGLVIFGIHLALVGYLAWTSGFAPKTIGALLLLGAVGYVVANLGKILVPSYGQALDTIVAAPAALGELTLAVWLLVRARRVPE
jgi:uncharacterized protein DUF4386